MKVEKDANNGIVVGNEEKNATKNQPKRKNIQFSTTIPTDLYEEVEEFCSNRSLDRTKLIENHLRRILCDEEYLMLFLFPDSKEQETITTKQPTNYEDRQAFDSEF